jgi:hypothetical protein
MVDVPGAIAASGRDRASQRILQRAAVERRIDPGMGDGTSEIPRQDWLIG